MRIRLEPLSDWFMIVETSCVTGDDVIIIAPDSADVAYSSFNFASIGRPVAVPLRT